MIKIKHYGDIIKAIRKKRGITSSQKLILMILATYSDKDGTSIFPSYQTITDDTGYERRTVIRIIKSLCEINLIKKYQVSLSCSNNYELNLPEILKNSHLDALETDTSGDPMTPEVVIVEHQGGDPMTPYHTIYHSKRVPKRKLKRTLSVPASLEASKNIDSISDSIGLSASPPISQIIADQNRAALETFGEVVDEILPNRSWTESKQTGSGNLQLGSSGLAASLRDEDLERIREHYGSNAEEFLENLEATTWN